MKISPEQLNEEYKRFIEFGDFMDRTTRLYLVRYFQERLGETETMDLSKLKDTYFHYFRGHLDEIFMDEEVHTLFRENGYISRKIVLDTLGWIRKTYTECVVKDPYENERMRLETWSGTLVKRWASHWHIPEGYIREAYSPEELNPGFYTRQKEKLFRGREFQALNQEEVKRFERILHDLLANWDARLTAKSLQNFLHNFEQEHQEYKEFMQAKVREFRQLQDLISPFAEYTGKYWDLTQGLWQETDLDLLREYDDILSQEKEIAALADELGRMRKAEIEIQEETYEKSIVRQEWVEDPLLKNEIDGVHESADLSHLLSSEVSLLSDIATESLFLKKYADQQLLSFRFSGKRLEESTDKETEINRKVKLKQKGPFIVCIDTSESMIGRPEQIAKVLCFAILKMASKDNRSAYLINFSTGIQTIDLHDIADSIGDLVRFLRKSFYGGTDITVPLHEALNMLQTHNYENADVLIISDFIVEKLEDDLLKPMARQSQNKGTQFHSLVLSETPNQKLIEQFDSTWIYDLHDRNLFRKLNKDLHHIHTRVF